MTKLDKNVVEEVVDDFGAEWQTFDQGALSESERQRQFDAYFALFPWEKLSSNAIGFDAGCGSGRWATLVAPRVGHLHCVDPSKAIDVAKKNLEQFKNCTFHQNTIADLPFPDGSMDFGYSLGVLHHIPDTQRGLTDCVNKLKPGAPFLVYIYYAFDNQPLWYKLLWRVSDLGRRLISRSPYPIKYILSQVIALTVYFPLANLSYFAKKAGLSVHSWPLSAYFNRSFYSMRTDALDRFGTKLEKRFTKAQIASMMDEAGLESVRFSPLLPFWCAIGHKR
jgi:ubiquinone/menaquinone biosynthesis C-methylase UbiE